MRRRRLAALVAIGLLGAAALGILTSPVYRAYVLGGPTPIPRGVPQTATRSAAPVVRPEGPLEIGLASAVAAERADGLVINRSGRLQVPIGEGLVRPSGPGVPAGWQLQTFAGQPLVELVRSEIGPAFRIRSEASSFALYRGIVLDLDEYPVLSWAWKVTRLPGGGDVRHAATDDQAVQVYVVFPRWPAPRSTSEVIGYIWDTTAPAGARLTSPKAPNVRLVVVESGRESLGVWRRYQRNVRDDYVAAFGHRPPRVGSVAVMTDGDDTGSLTEALVGDLAFSSPGGR